MQAAIRDTLVLPNSESIGIRWMLAEKDDWVPRNVAPFIWIHQDSGNETSNPIDANNLTSGGSKASASARTSSDGPELKQQKSKNSESRQDPARKSDSLTLSSISSFSASSSLRNSKSLEELSKPLLESGQQQETSDSKDNSMPSIESDHEASEEKMEDVSVCSSPSNSVAAMDRSISSVQQDDSKPKKIGKRERMLDLRKKMSEKFEEKKRHIVEKMRASEK
jgi:hypothetical protein